MIFAKELQHLVQKSDHHVEGNIEVDRLVGNLGPTTSNVGSRWYQGGFFLLRSKVLFVPQGRKFKTRSPPLLRVLKKIRMWNLLEATIHTSTTQDHRSPLITPQTTDLQSKSDGGRLVCLSLEILNYATFALIMRLKTRRTLCWGVSYVNIIRNKFPSLFEDVLEALSLSFHRIISWHWSPSHGSCNTLPL